jgi:hypothetical protein
VNCYALAPDKGFQVIDVVSNCTSCVIWGYPGGSANPTDGNNAKLQANLAEFTICAGGENYYGISIVVCPSSLQPDF